MMRGEIPECDHVPEGTMVGFVELWATDDGFSALSFVWGRSLPEVVVTDDNPDDPLTVASEMLAAELDEMVGR